MTRSISLTLGMTLGLLVAGAVAAERPTHEVKVGDITIKVPKSWKQQPPSNRLRLAQFEVPATGDGQDPCELSIFSFGPGGTVKAQVDRWIGQFQAKGRNYKGATGKSSHGEYVYVELSGTYLKSAGPFFGKKIPVPNSRMLVAMIAVKNKGNYFLKLVGDDKTIATNAKAFRHAFGATDKEEKLELN